MNINLDRKQNLNNRWQ